MKYYGTDIKMTKKDCGYGHFIIKQMNAKGKVIWQQKFDEMGIYDAFTTLEYGCDTNAEEKRLKHEVKRFIRSAKNRW